MKRPKHVKAPAYLSEIAAGARSPEPVDAASPAGEEDKPDPTRYGDWEKKGIAIDF